MAYPLLLEKLSATGGAARLDVLHTLTACMPVYGAGPTGAHAADLWSYVRLDIVQPTDAAVVPVAQETLTTMIRVLGPTHAHVHMILEACIDDVRDVHARRASDAMLVLACLVRAGPDTCATATQRVLPVLMREASPRPWALLATYLDMLSGTSTPLDREALLALLTSEAAVSSVHGMRGLVALVRVPHSMHADDAARAASSACMLCGTRTRATRPRIPCTDETAASDVSRARSASRSSGVEVPDSMSRYVASRAQGRGDASRMRTGSTRCVAVAHVSGPARTRHASTSIASDARRACTSRTSSMHASRIMWTCAWVGPSTRIMVVSVS